MSAVDSCPEAYICSISLDVMLNPVKLKQTGQVYDHSSFHEWLTQGGSICPMTAIPLKNPIVLQPQTSLREEIWLYQKRQQESKAQQPFPKEQYIDQELMDQESFESWPIDATQTDSLNQKREQEVQHQLAADRLPNAPVEQGPTYFESLILWVWKRGQAITKPKRPSTYFISQGNHVYCRGDLY